MIVHLKGVAATGPGIENWDTLRQRFLTGAAPDVEFMPRPRGAMLPGTERRRASFTVKLAIDVAQAALAQSGIAPNDAAVVFASANGDTDTIHQICETLATPERMVSPTRFHNSVHNAPAGYWSIASGSMQPSSTLAAWTGSFAAALIEAAAQCQAENVPVLLAAFDTPFPEPLFTVTPGRHPFGIALVLDTNAENRLAGIRLAIDSDADVRATSMNDADLEALRCDSTASRALPLLAALASTQARQEIVFDYVDGLRLRVMLDQQVPV